MSEAATAETMKHAQQHAILCKQSWTTGGRLRVQCTHSTAPLIKLAGVRDPQPLEFYSIPAKRDLQGFLILDTSPGAAKTPPVGEGDDSLFEPGGIFSNEDPVDHGTPATAAAHSDRSEIAECLAELAEIPCTRTFEINSGPQRKFRIQIVGYEDQGIPSPNEREHWVPAKPSDADVREACAALLHNRLNPFEKV